MDRFLFLLAVVACSGVPTFADLLKGRTNPVDSGVFITIPGLEGVSHSSVEETNRREWKAETEVDNPWEQFGSESDNIYFPDLPSSGETKFTYEKAIAKPRKLLIDDGLNEDKVLQEMPAKGRDSSFVWRLKDHSIVERLDPDILADEGPARDFETFADEADLLSSPTAADLQERHSSVTTSCGSDIKCARTVRQKLLQDLMTSHSEPLTSFIEYRLKRRPSIYVSKRPQTSHDIGIPDIYEMEVEVMPVTVPSVLQSFSRSKKKQLPDSDSKDTPHLAIDEDEIHHRKFVPVSSSPKFVSLGSLYDPQEASLPSQLHRDAPRHKNWTNKDVRNQVLFHSMTGVQVNSKGGGIRRHLPFRRPISFKHTRTVLGQEDGYTPSHSENKTELSTLEKITLNKTPGLVIEHPNIFGSQSFGSLPPPSVRFPGRRKRPMRFRSNKQRQKKRKQISRLKDHSSQQSNKGDSVHSPQMAVGYEIPAVNLQIPSNQYFPSKGSAVENVQPSTIYNNKDINGHSIPSRSQIISKKVTEQPETSYKNLNPLSESYQTSEYHELSTKGYPAQVPGKEFPGKQDPKVPPREEHSYPIPAYDYQGEGYPKRGKGQVPRWLMNLKREKANATPPPVHFPEASTIKWIPIESTRDIGPMFIMPKEKYLSPHTSSVQSPKDYKPPTTRQKISHTYRLPSQTYEIPEKEYIVPTKDSPVKEYLPPNGAHEALASVTPIIHTKKGYGDSFQSTPSAGKGYVTPPSFALLSSKPTRDRTSTPDLPSAYTTITSKVAYTTEKSNTSVSSHKPRRTQIIIINDDDYYNDYDDYMEDEYYDDDDDDDYNDDEYYDDDYYDYDVDDYYDDDEYVFEIKTKGQRPFMPHIVMTELELDDFLHQANIMEFGYILGIPGLAGRDYPILQYIPLTTFRCHLVADYPGYYADMEVGCQVFHVCHRSGRQDSFLCPNGTIFNQKYFVCDWWYNFACEDAAFFYPVNAAIEYQTVPLHEGHLQEGYSFQSSSSSKFDYRSTTGKRTRRKLPRKKGKSGYRRRLRQRPHSRIGQRRVKKHS